MSHKVGICCVAIGGWYPRGLARMIRRFHECSPGFEITAWVNTYPPGAPGSIVVDGYEYGPYCAKPWALRHAFESGCDAAILLDAAFFPIRPIHPLFEHIAQRGYYFCRNGNSVGEWSSDRCLDHFQVSREEAFQIPEISSYCVGLNFHDVRAVDLLKQWCFQPVEVIAGHHTNTGHKGRNVGFVSDVRLVKGHRHDQTVLSILAHQLGMDELIDRPKFTSYLGSESSETVLVNQGMGS